ncbi:DUF4318 domain-containing protein [Caproiciproducens galactitolivorans]|uniref:DUF4318 domain-containing protein n=1 Tax=Caproiciproducens galactitolivorans TaxID=642589 RepID=A0ABT4BUY1_9FIRM|nr:DUF4318 domain-containing protein [Caproiciproducens galactitolivorans]MCY1714702.1 DUF4318 domain-containing protein [Caproiciproducens galactitolivorans]
MKIDELKVQKKLFEKIAQEASDADFAVEEYLDCLETEEQNGAKFFNIAFDFIIKAKNYLGKGMEDLMKKRFDIELDETLTYPTTQKICSVIAEFCTQTQQEFKFVNKERPVTFSLAGDLYRAEVRMARGGYILYCIEI